MNTSIQQFDPNIKDAYKMLKICVSIQCCSFKLSIYKILKWH